jgi:hypothetical protein
MSDRELLELIPLLDDLKNAESVYTALPAVQQKMLAKCNPQESVSFDVVWNRSNQRV